MSSCHLRGIADFEFNTPLTGVVLPIFRMNIKEKA